MTKMFCGDCGSQLFGKSSGRAGVIGIKVGTIDDASAVKPAISVFVSKALPFSIIPDDTENFDKMPS